MYHGEEPIAQGTEQTPESISDLMIEAKTGMSAQLEAFAANAIEYMKRERTLLLDGVGIPEISTDLADRQVLLVAASADTKAQLKSLKKYISDFRPVLVGVDGGADALRAAGYTPELIIGNPEIDRLARRCAAAPKWSSPRTPTGTRPVWSGCRTSASALSRSRPAAAPRTWRCCWPTAGTRR